MPEKKDLRKGFIDAAICAALAILTFCVYFSVLSGDFLSIDDPVYVTANPHVTKGITAEGINWALDFGHDGGPYWMPLTMLSHMIDCQFFGTDPGRHHLTSLIIHIINTILLFFFLRKITGSGWKSGVVSALFALHPMNVESVAWITSRKNVLNTFFWLTTMLFYLRYLDRKSLWAFLLIPLSFLAGMMTKPTIITLIFSLLLLDMWPLHRFILFRDEKKGRISIRLMTKENLLPLLEKLPLLALAGILLYMNFSVDGFSSEATGIADVPVSLRLANLFVSFLIYMGKLFVPVNLSVFYPYPASIPLWQTAGAVAVFAGMVILSLAFIKKHPWIFTCWFWFTGNLVMVSGIIQGGYWPAYADRFVYIPQIGFFILILKGLALILPGQNDRRMRGVYGSVFLIFITFLSFLTWRQAGYWQNGVKLYSHALEVNSDDVVSRVNLAFALDMAGESEKAIRCYRDVIRLYPDYWQAHSNLGTALEQQGATEEAVFHLKEALKINPDSERALFNLAMICERENRPEDALKYFVRATQINSLNYMALLKSGELYEKKKKFSEALQYYRKAEILKPHDEGLKKKVEIVARASELISIAMEKIKTELDNKPDDPDLLVKAGNIYKILGMTDVAEGYFNKALGNAPEHPKALSGLAEIYIDNKKYDGAAGIYLSLLNKKKRYRLSLYYNLACVYSLKNDREEALMWLKKAVDGGFSHWDIIIAEKHFDNIRETGYFKQIKEKAEREPGRQGAGS